jgi:hypothetical protein
MRSDGSIKSMTTGVSTVDKSEHTDRQHMKECTNWRNDQKTGLRRRAPARLVKRMLQYTDDAAATVDVDDFTLGTDILKPFEIDGELYWFFSNTDNDPTLSDVAVFDKDGVEVTTDVTADGGYLNGAAGNSDIQLSVNGNAVYIANKTVTVEKIEGSGPVYTNHSMITVREAPKVYSTITVTWENPDRSQTGITYEIGEDHGTQPIPDVAEVDNGVNTIAGYLKTKIEAAILAAGQNTHLEVDQEGATVVFRNVTAVTADQREYSNVVVSDGAGEAIIAINGSVGSIVELPRNASAGQLLTVSPDPETNRGAYYMRSVAQLEAEAPPTLPAQAHLLQPDEATSTDGLSRTQGHFPLFGITAPVFTPTALPGYPSHTITGFISQYATDLDPQSQTRFIINVNGPLTNNPPAEAVQYVELWDDSGASPVRVLSVFMYRILATDGASSSITQWEGFVDGPVVLDTSVTYKAYYTDQIASFNSVPEVRWVEDSAPGQDTQLNAKTMPHILERKDDGSFAFGSFNSINNTASDPLARRASGDDVSNPFPEFVGKKIKDVAFFQNRFALLTEDRCNMSVTNLPNDWFRGTVTQVLSTGPIAIGSTSANASSLTHFVQHNNDLMIFSPSGQFRFDGKVPLTPSNSALPQASAYPTELLASPVSSGNDVFFSTSYGGSFGISQFSLDPQIDSLSLAKPMADDIIGLLATEPEQIVTAPNLGIVIVRLKNNPNELYALEFIPTVDILRDVVPTWSDWDYGGMNIISMAIDGGTLNIMATSGTDTTPRLYKQALNETKLALKNVYGLTDGDICLDHRENQTGVGTTLTLPADYPADADVGDTLVVIQGVDGDTPYEVVPYTRNGQVLTLTGSFTSQQFFYGFPYESRLVLPDVEPRDPSGNILSQAKLRVTDWLLAITGHIDADVYRKPPVDALYAHQEWRGIVVGTGYTDDIGYSRAEWRIQFKHAPEDADLILSTTSHIDAELHQLEWRGTYIKKGRRF